MTPWQVLKQIDYLLGAEAWDESPTEKVFAAVKMTPGLSPEAQVELRAPFVLLNVEDAEMDEDEPRQMLQRFSAMLVVSSGQDAIGEAALVGGSRGGGQGSSKGRGILEIEEKLIDTIAKLDQTSGVRLRLLAKGAVAAAVTDEGEYFASRTYTFEGICTVERHYHPALRFAATVAGPNVSLSWVLPPDRWDRKRMVLRRASGSTPPASATAGTGVTLSGDLATSVTDAPGSGTWSYALFAGYDETSSGSPERYSASATKTVTV